MPQSNPAVFLAAFFSVWMGAPAFAPCDGLHEAVLLPTAAEPETVGEDRMLAIQVSLRLPLTPPPGVQQTAAVKGWQVMLTADGAWTPEAEPAKLRYELPVMRIRPVAGNTYRVLVELPPWLPGGRFDVSVRGPGFAADSPKALIVPSPKETAVDIAEISRDTKGEFVLTNAGPKAIRRRLQLLLTGNHSGISISIQGKKLIPVSIAFARLPYDGARVLSFTVDIPAAGTAGPGIVRIQAAAEKAAPCKGEITLSDAKENDAMAYRDLQFHTKTAPHTVIWDFGDGRFGIGNPARHRWLLSDAAKISVWGFDASGRVCRTDTRAALNELTHTGGCSCIAIGR